MGSKRFFLSGLASYVIWGFIPIFLKQLTAYDDFEIIFYRIGLAALIMAVVLTSQGREAIDTLMGLYRRSRREFYRMLTMAVLGGALLATNWVTYVYVVNHVSVSAASFAYLILPIATAFLALLILGEKLSVVKWAAVGLSAVSCYLMANVDAKQILYILAITLSYSFYLISQRHNTAVPRRVNLALQMVFGTLLMLLINPIHTAPVDLPANFWFYAVIIAGVFTVTPLMLNLYALNGMASSQLAFLIYINPIIAFITGIFLYHEDLTATAALAYSLLAVGVIIFNWEFIVRIAEKTGLKTETVTE